MDFPQRALIQQLESLRRAGVEQLGVAADEPIAPSAGDAPEPVVDAERREDVRPPKNPLVETPVAQSNEELLQVVQAEVAECTLCPELATTRTQTVFGVGNANPRLVFLGEAPGADEDAQGIPFVGRAGKLLTQIIEACTIQRDDVYILNILKCRPPGNRNPSDSESANCRSFLNRQLEILKPEFLCCLGSVAAKNLLDTTTSIGKLRGQFYDYQGIQVMATYHPAYLLRNPPAKKACWDDMKMLMREMGLEIPERYA